MAAWGSEDFCLGGHPLLRRPFRMEPSLCLACGPSRGTGCVGVLGSRCSAGDPHSFRDFVTESFPFGACPLGKRFWGERLRGRMRPLFALSEIDSLYWTSFRIRWDDVVFSQLLPPTAALFWWSGASSRFLGAETFHESERARTNSRGSRCGNTTMSFWDFMRVGPACHIRRCPMVLGPVRILEQFLG